MVRAPTDSRAVALSPPRLFPATSPPRRPRRLCHPPAPPRPIPTALSLVFQISGLSNNIKWPKAPLAPALAPALASAGQASGGGARHVLLATSQDGAPLKTRGFKNRGFKGASDGVTGNNGPGIGCLSRHRKAFNSKSGAFTCGG